MVIKRIKRIKRVKRINAGLKKSKKKTNILKKSEEIEKEINKIAGF